MQTLVIEGYLAADPSILSAQGSGRKRASFRVLETTRYRRADGEPGERTTGFNCVCFNEATAENYIAAYARKGSRVVIQGHVENDSWTGKDGVEHFDLRVVVDDMRLKNRRAPASGEADAGDAYVSEALSAVLDDDIPFGRNRRRTSVYGPGARAPGLFRLGREKEGRKRASRSGLLTECLAMTSAIWTPENTQRLVALWKEGRTAAWIARALGPGVSRCAVLGKVYRLGLARGPEARQARPATARRAKRRRRDEETASQRAARVPRPCKARAADASSAATVATPSSPTTTILAVGFGQCRWPYGHSGEAGFGLCGRSVARGAFCAPHAEVAYQKRSCTVGSLLRMAGVD